MDKQQIADKLAVMCRAMTPDNKLAQDDIPAIDALAARLALHWSTPAAAGGAPASSILLTQRVACETIGHESIVLECYKDSAKPPVWTWGIGVTERSGYSIMQFKDNPTTVEKTIEVYIDRCRKVYIPGVLRAFNGVALTEEQFAALLSFHYNTGAVEKSDLTQLLRTGQRAAARQFWENHYLGGGKERREKEAALYFDGVWSNDGMTTVWPVKKPSYTPDWAHGKRIDIRSAVAEALAK